MTISNKGFLRADHFASLARDLAGAINDPASTAFFDFNIDILADGQIFRGHWSHRDDPQMVSRWFEKYDDEMRFIGTLDGSDFADQLNAFFAPSQYVNLEPRPKLTPSLLETSITARPAIAAMKIWFSWLPLDGSLAPSSGASICHDRVFVKLDDDDHALHYALGPNGHAIDRSSILEIQEW